MCRINFKRIAKHTSSVSFRLDFTQAPKAAEKILTSLTSYLDNTRITWLYQTSRGDGIIRRAPENQECPKGKPHSLSHTDFGKWALSNSQDGLPTGGTCSCYEIILKAGVENGLIDHKQIYELYKPNTQSPCKWMDEDLCRDKIVLKNTNPTSRQARPKQGDLILFGDSTRAATAEQSPSTNVHVVTALGNKDGVVRVISHHRRDQPPVELTLEELIQEMPGLSGQKMIFSEPQWPM